MRRPTHCIHCLEPLPLDGDVMSVECDHCASLREMRRRMIDPRYGVPPQANRVGWAIAIGGAAILAALEWLLGVRQ